MFHDSPARARHPWAVAVGFASLAYSYLTLPDVRPLRTANPATTAFIELRASEARDKGLKPRRVQQWRATAASRLTSSARCSSRKTMRSGSTRAWIWSSSRNRSSSTGRAEDGARRQHDHPAAGEEPVPVAIEKSGQEARELIIARRLEAELKKARIFEIYLNVIEWGDGIYGVDAAAQTYFHTSAADLDPTQSALLAGAIVNPRVLNPAHPTRAVEAPAVDHSPSHGSGHAA